MSFIIKGDSIKFEGNVEDLKKEISLQFSNRSVSAQKIASDYNTCIKTLYNWAHKYGTYKRMQKNYSIIQKIKLLLKYESLADEAKGAMLRSEGLHEEELSQWRAEIEGLPDKAPKPLTETAVIRSIKSDLKRTKELLRNKSGQLIKKEKELKEANALIELKKKADLLFGNEDEE